MEKSSSKTNPELKASSSFESIIDWGIGLRPQYFRSLEVLTHSQTSTDLPLLEVMSDNLLFQRGGPGLFRTQQIAEQTKVLLHGIGLNIGSADDLDWSYIDELKRLSGDLGVKLISDHLSFSKSAGISTFELLPIVRSNAYLRHVAERVMQIQDRWQATLVLENVSAYVEHAGNEMSEGEFFTELARLTGSGVLPDVNNLYVNSVNFGFDPFVELARFPLASVQQFHVAGHSVCERTFLGLGEDEKQGSYDTYLFDTHDHPAHDQVIDLLAAALVKTNASSQHKIPVVIEWDNPTSQLDIALTEMQRIRLGVEGRLRLITQDHSPVFIGNPPKIVSKDLNHA